MPQLVPALLVPASFLALTWGRRPLSADLDGARDEHVAARESRSTARPHRRTQVREAASEPPSGA